MGHYLSNRLFHRCRVYPLVLDAVAALTNTKAPVGDFCAPENQPKLVLVHLAGIDHVRF